VENGSSYERIPKWEEVNKSLLNENFAGLIPGTRSREGNAILYCKLAKLIPSELGKDYLKTIVDFIIWNNSIGTFLDGIDFHRNGLIFICDLEGVGWKNIDIALQRKVNNAMMDNFPLRIHKVLLINPPSIIGAIIGCIRVFVKKKIMDRIQTISSFNELLNFIDEDNLWNEFGGNCQYTIPELLEDITNRLNEKPLKIPTLTKNKKPTGMRLSARGTSNSNHEVDSPKKSTKRKIKKNVEIDGVNMDDIPPEVLSELQEGNDEPDISDDESNNLKIRRDSTPRTGKDSKKKRRKSN